MEDFKSAVTYEGELPLSHEEVLDYIEDEDYSEDTEIALDALTYVGGGSATGMGIAYGLQESGLLDYAGMIDPAAVILGLPITGAINGAYLTVKLDGEKRKKRHRVKNIEETEKDFEQDLRDEEYVLVRDHLLGDGEPLERTGDVAAELYDEATGLYETQFIEEVEREFSGIDYQLSLVKENEVIRSFCTGKDIVEDAKEFYQDKEVESLLEENSEIAVSLEEYE